MKQSYLILTSLIALTLGSCKKDFLITEPNQFTTPERLSADAKQDPKLLNGNIKTKADDH